MDAGAQPREKTHFVAMCLVGAVAGTVAGTPLAGSTLRGGLARLANTGGTPGGGARAATSTKQVLCCAAHATVWTAHSLEKVFPDDDPPSGGGAGGGSSGTSEAGTPHVQPTITGFAARDEHAQFQLVVSPRGTQLANVTIMMEGVPPAVATMSYQRVEYVDVRAAVNPQNRTGAFPDPLPLARPGGATINAAQASAPFWVTLHAGVDARAGVYEGTITVRSSEGTLCAAALSLKVFNFSVTNRTQLTDAGLRVERGLDRFFAREQGTPAQVVQRYYDFLVDYRVNQQVFHSVYPYIEARWSANRSAVVLETAAFDAALHRLIGQGLKYFRFPSPTNATMSGNEGGASGYLDENVANPTHNVPHNATWQFAGNFSARIFTDAATPTFNPGFKRLFTLLYGQICKHLVSTGTLDKALVSFYDEPIYRVDFNSAALLALNTLFKEVCPGVHLWQDEWPVPEVSVTSPVYKNLTTDVSQWLVDWEQYVQDGVPAQVAQAHREHGAVTTMYDNAIPIIDLPWTRTRSFPWMIASTNVFGDFRGDGLQGSLSWYSISTWCLPVTVPRCSTFDPWVHANNIGPYGPPRDQGVQAAGFGSLIYPAREGHDEVGPISSIRWEHFRKGLEDAEYFYTLARLLRVARRFERAAPFSSTRPSAACAALVAAGERVLEEIKLVVWGWTPEGPEMLTAKPTVQTPTNAPYTTNVTLVDEVLHDAARMIEGISRECT